MELPKNYLKKEAKYRLVRLMDIVTLLHNMHEGARHKDVGFEDTMETLGSLTGKLNRQMVWVDPSNLESCLWSCNLMEEQKQFWDVKGRTFEEFLIQLIGVDRFDRFYNTVETKESSK
jgi:hypothetical protein